MVLLSALLVLASQVELQPDHCFELWPDWDGGRFPAPMMTVSEDGKLMAAAFREGYEVHRLTDKGWELALSTSGDVNVSVTPALSPDGKWVASARPKGVMIWSLDMKKQVLVDYPKDLEIPMSYGSLMAYSPDGSTLAVVTGTLYHWWIRFVDPKTGTMRATEVNDVDGGFRSLRWSDDGELLLAWGGNMRLIDKEGKLVHGLSGFPESYGPYFMSPFTKDKWVLWQAREKGTVQVAQSSSDIAVKSWSLKGAGEGDDLNWGVADPAGDWVAYPRKERFRISFEGLGEIVVKVPGCQEGSVIHGNRKWLWMPVGKGMALYSVNRLRKLVQR